MLTRGQGRVSAMDSGGERSMIREYCKIFTLQEMPEMTNGLLDCQQLSIKSAVFQLSWAQCSTEKGQINNGIKSCPMSSLHIGVFHRVFPFLAAVWPKS